MRNVLHSCTLVISGLLVTAALTACHQNNAPSRRDHDQAVVANTGSVGTRPAASSSTGADKQAAPVRSAPDFGGTSTRHVEVTATGPSLETAVDNAIRLAIEQVNGKQVSASTLQMAGRTGSAPHDIGSPAYANWVVSATSGAVTGFSIISQKQVHAATSTDTANYKASHGASWDRGHVDASASASANASARVEVGDDTTHAEKSAVVEQKVKGDWDRQQGASNVEYHGKHTEYASHWEVRIGADVAVYRQSEAAKRTRVVVAMPHVDASSYTVGNKRIPARRIAATVQEDLSGALAQSHRFTVLARHANAEIGREMDLIRSGNASKADTARLGQQLAADLIVIPSIERFEYLRHSRHLRLADRTVVSYSGGGDVQLQVVNAVTGQIVLSQSFSHEFPSTRPTTLGVSVDGQKLASRMMAALDKKIVSSILLKTYPLSVLRVNGRQVIINQGGDLVQKGATYQAVKLGDSMTDPQTGESLGPTEMPCCTVFIDRVTPKLSYGHIVEKDAAVAQPYKPGSIELRGKITLTASHAVASASRPAQHKQKKSRPHKSTTHKPTVVPAASDPNW